MPPLKPMAKLAKRVTDKKKVAPKRKAKILKLANNRKGQRFV